MNPDQSPQAIQPSAPTPPVQTVVPPQGSTPPPSGKPSMFANKFVIIGIVLLFLIPILLAFAYFFVIQKNSSNQPNVVPTVIPIETSAPTETPTSTPIPTLTVTPTQGASMSPTLTPSATSTP